MEIEYGRTGTQAELHELLVGAKLHISRYEKDIIEYAGKTGGLVVRMVKVANGKPAEKVNVRISERLTQTRTAQTPNTWRIEKA